jgi:DNA replication protein
MNEFKGFPARMQFTPVPNILFSSLLPEIEDMAELKVLLYFLHLLYSKKGNLRYVSLNEMAGQAGLRQSLKGAFPDNLKMTMEKLAGKGIILHLQTDKTEAGQDLYFLNSEANKLLISRISRGEIVIPGFEPLQTANAASENPSDIYTLYEQNIGLLTPIIADELKEAGKHYPESWIKEAIREASALNKRNWRYCARILEHWATEGKDDGTHRRNITQNTDPDKYVRGKYGHMVQR